MSLITGLRTKNVPKHVPNRKIGTFFPFSTFNFQLACAAMRPKIRNPRGEEQKVTPRGKTKMRRVLIIL